MKNLEEIKEEVKEYTKKMLYKDPSSIIEYF
jgi:hypothetical protein